MDDPMEFRTCTAQFRNFDFCNRPSVPEAPFPICFRHASLLYGFLLGRIDASDRTMSWFDSDVSTQIASNVRRARQDYGQRGAVYYLQLGDLLKIGCTYQRVAVRANAYPPHRVLLAAEPGGFDLEQERLAQFAHLRVSGKEWHDFGPDLREHVAAIRERHGIPEMHVNWSPKGSDDAPDLYTILSQRNADAAADESLKAVPLIGTPEADALLEQMLDEERRRKAS